MQEQEFAPGHVFYQRGDKSDVAYLLQEGAVELLGGTEEPLHQVALYIPGDVFGEMALVEERPQSFTARAVTEGRVIPMSRTDFEYSLLHHPGRTRRYLLSLFERLRSLSAQVGSQAEAMPPAPSTVAANQTAVAEAASETRESQPESTGPSELPITNGKPSDWKVILHPLTRKAAETLPEEGLIVTRFPLRVGRAPGPGEPEAMDLNDLWLLDTKPYNISRNHCEIYVDRDGPKVRDRGSHLGGFVNDAHFGGNAVLGYGKLEPGDNVLIIGSRMSPYQFRVTVEPA